MVWIESLNMQQWFVNVLSGSSSYFSAIAIFLILVGAGMLRMTGLTLGFLIFMFLLMFSGFVPMSLLILVATIGGILVGTAISRIVK